MRARGIEGFLFRSPREWRFLRLSGPGKAQSDGDGVEGPSRIVMPITVWVGPRLEARGARGEFDATE